MTLIVAHAGHWIANFLYVAPVAVVMVALGWQSRRDKRSARRESGEG